LPGAAREMLPGVGRLGEAPRGLEHDVHAELLPRQRRRILLLEHGDLLAIDLDRVTAGGDVALVRAVHRVVLEEVRERARVGEVVHRDDGDVGDVLLAQRANDLAADAAEPVDSHPNCHCWSSSCQEARSPAAGARPKVTRLMMRAPLSKSVAAQAESVAPVVMTSSTSTTWAPR